MNCTNIAEQIIATDARYNNYRFKDQQFKTLYIRRRSQLLRDNAKKDTDPSQRAQYLNLRKQLLAKKYGPLPVAESLRGSSIKSRNSSVEASFDNLYVPHSYDIMPTSHRPTHRRFYSSGSSKNWGSIGSLKMMSMSEVIPDELYGDGVVPTDKAAASRAMAGNTTLSENYAFSGMFHIFDQHADTVTSIKFAHNEKHLLACSSKDKTISVCTLEPPKVKFVLMGHTAAVNDFDWSVTNDMIVSVSNDTTTQIWNANTGQNIRILSDQFHCPVTCCRFQSLNNNFIVSGNQRGHLQVYNMSTGLCLKDGIAKGTAPITCLEIDSSGTIIYAGDERGVVSSFSLNIMTGKLIRDKRFVIHENAPVTSLCSRTWINREARDPSLLISCACSSLFLYRYVDSRLLM